MNVTHGDRVMTAYDRPCHFHFLENCHFFLVPCFICHKEGSIPLFTVVSGYDRWCHKLSRWCHKGRQARGLYDTSHMGLSETDNGGFGVPMKSVCRFRSSRTTRRVPSCAHARAALKGIYPLRVRAHGGKFSAASVLFWGVDFSPKPRVTVSRATCAGWPSPAG